MIKKTLYFGNPTYLSSKNEQLIIRQPNIEQERTIPMEDIGVIVLDCQQITLTSGVIEKLLEKNCALITCNSNHIPTGLMLSLEGNTLQNERFREQLDASIPLKKQLWQQTVQCKIRNQAAVLKQTQGIEIKNMLNWANNVRSGDSENLEARAAAYYWKNIFPMISGFTRERGGVAPNNLLNYGYAILRAIVARALVASGLLPTLGIHHHNRYNAFALADDIMEPYRPFVDQYVLGKVRPFDVPMEELTKEMRARLLQMLTCDVMLGDVQRPLMIALSSTTASLARYYMKESNELALPRLI